MDRAYGSVNAYSMRIRVDKEGNFGFWGPLSWSNLLDWLICLQAVLILVFSFWASTRGVSALAFTMPLVAAMCISHAGAIYLSKERPLRISQVPFFYLPLLLWVGLRIYSEQSNGIAAIEWLCWLQLFIFFWVLSNHGRMRSQAKLLCAVPMGLLLWACFLPLWKRKLIGSTQSNLIEGNSDSVAASLQAFQLFANYELWGAYIALCVPAFCVAAMLSRLETIMRILFTFLVIFCLYVLASHHVWGAFAISLLALAYSVFRFGQFTQVVRKSVLAGAIGLSVLLLGEAFFAENVQSAILSAKEVEFIGFGTYLWGMGRGAWLPILSDSSHLGAFLKTDLALVCLQYGLIGLLAGLVPYAYILLMGWRAYQAYPSLSSRGRGRRRVVKYERFCLLMALFVAVAAILNVFCALSLYEPSYGFLLILALSLLVKLGFKRKIYLPDSLNFRRAYLGMAALLALYLLIAST